MWEALDKLDISSEKVGKETISQVSKMRAEFSLSLMRIERDLGEAKLAAAHQHDLFTTSTGDTANMHHETLVKVSAMLLRCQSKASDTLVALTVLNALNFHGRRQVQDPYQGTLEWITHNKLTTWLESSDPIFWISGKPGSGKSTLMKYLVDDPRTSLALQSWSNPQKLVIANYFFWINGTSLQRSLQGLLRSLLYEILRQNMNITKDVLPEAWSSVSMHCDASSPASFSSESLEWSDKILLDACQRLYAVQSTIKFCFFIDGLDEYFSEHDKDHEYLLSILDCLTKAGVKLCVVSRPWNVFEEAFGNDVSRKLYLEDLNRKDIELYVLGKLTAHRNFADIDRADADDIVKEIINKSHGVFLWVRLAVRSLVEGLRNHDSIVLLRSRLREFPDDLNDFFKHMFDSLDPIYRPRLSHMFQIALAAGEPLSLIAYWFLDAIDDNPEVALKPSTLDVSSFEFQNKMEVMTSQINGRSRGLLECTKEYDTRSDPGDYVIEPRVDFLHRTVKDYIITTDIKRMLSKWQQEQFDVDFTLINILLAEYKARLYEKSDKRKFLMKIFFEVAARVEHAGVVPQDLLEAYMSELDRAVTQHMRVHSIAGLRTPWQLIKCLSLHSAFLRYSMPVSFARRVRGFPPTLKEKVDCLTVLIGKSSSDLNVIFENVAALLSSDHPIKTDESFRKSVRTNMQELSQQEAVYMLVGLSRYDFVNSKTRALPQFRERLAQELTTNEVKELWQFLKSPKSVPQPFCEPISNSKKKGEPEWGLTWSRASSDYFLPDTTNDWSGMSKLTKPPSVTTVATSTLPALAPPPLATRYKQASHVDVGKVETEQGTRHVPKREKFKSLYRKFKSV